MYVGDHFLRCESKKSLTAIPFFWKTRSKRFIRIIWNQKCVAKVILNAEKTLIDFGHTVRSSTIKRLSFSAVSSCQISFHLNMRAWFIYCIMSGDPYDRSFSDKSPTICESQTFKLRNIFHPTISDHGSAHHGKNILWFL